MWHSVLLFLALIPAVFLQSGEWAEKTLEQMTLEEKIGQLFIVPVCPSRNDLRHKEDILYALHKHHIGGVIIKQGTLEQQFNAIQEVQSEAPYPLLVVADAEWGLAMCAPDAIQFPRNMTLGAIQDFSLIEQMGEEVGRQLRALGVHMNLAPVIDVNSNPHNPIIRMRSFGDDPLQVAERGKRFAKGLQNMGVLSCVKHFPGHGDTMTDSHTALPIIERSLAEFSEVELLPFQKLIHAGIDAVMSAHIVVPAVDMWPASLSFVWMTQWLQEKMGFHGLLITDALNMDALAKNFSIEESAKRAFFAGHDLLLYGDHIAPKIDDLLERWVPTACATLHQAVLHGEILEADLNRRVHKILVEKEKLELHKQRTPSGFLPEVFHTRAAQQLAKTLYSQAITLVRGDSFPLHGVTVVDQNRNFSARLQKRGVTILSDSSDILITCGDLRTDAEIGQIQESLRSWVQQGKRIIAIIFGAPYLVPYFSPWANTVLLAYEDTEETQEAVADVCVGVLQPRGKIPVELASHPSI